MLEAAAKTRLGQGIRTPARHILALEIYLARGGRKLAREDIQEGGFSRTVRPNERMDLCRRKLQGNPVNRGDPAEELCEIPGFKDGRFRHSFPPFGAVCSKALRSNISSHSRSRQAQTASQPQRRCPNRASNDRSIPTTSR